MKKNIQRGADLKQKYTKDEEISDLSNLLYEQDILISYLEKRLEDFKELITNTERRILDAEEKVFNDMKNGKFLKLPFTVDKKGNIISSLVTYEYESFSNYKNKSKI